MPPRPICERVRSQLSMLLDAELSALERRLVAVHLARCADCCAFEESIREFTHELRAAPPESPRQPIVLLRSRRRVSLTMAQWSAAATLLIAVLGVLSQFEVPQFEVPQSPGPNPVRQVATKNLFKTSWQPEREMAQIDAVTRTLGTDRPGPLPAL